MNAAIITIGDELLIGQVIDTNSAWIAQQLTIRGINVTQRIAIADDKQAITNTLNLLVGKTDWIFITGGLGPTADDITKPTLCDFFGGKMIINEQVLTHLKSIFTKRNRPFLERNIQQAEVPDCCEVLNNRIGTAPGMWFEKDNTKVISMPGVPFEMKAIMEEEALPLIEKHLGNEIIITKTLITLGVGESYIAEQIQDIESSLPNNISLAYLPAPGMVRLRLTAKRKNSEALEIEKFALLIQQRLGNIVIIDEDISVPAYIVNLLNEKNKTISFAESCTGGFLSHLITNIPGSSKILKGSIVAYANDIKETLLQVDKNILKQEGAVSEATVTQMALHSKEIFNTDISVAVSGILGPSGATPDKPLGLVWIAIAFNNSTYSKAFHFRYDRIQNKELTANAAFDLIRKCVLNLPFD